MTHTERLRQLLARPEIVVAPGMFNGLTALLVQQQGFDCAYLGGASISYARIGQPDIGLMSFAEVAETVGQIRERIEQQAHGPIEKFIDARKTMIHIYDLQFYANVMTEFCAGERYLNRCWSACVDGYQDEVHAYLTRVKEQFNLAHQRLLS